MPIPARSPVLACLSFLSLLLPGFPTATAQPLAGAAPAVALAEAPLQPLLRGDRPSPVLRLSVTVTNDRATPLLRSVRCRIDAPAGTVGEVSLYRTAGEAFHDSARLSAVRPMAAAFEIPVGTVLPAGTHHLWVCVTPAEKAAVGSRVTLSFEGMRAKGMRLPKGVLPGAPVTRTVGVVLRRKGDEGVHTYRIPGIIRTDKGTLIAVYDIRYTTSRDLPGNIDVGMSRSTDGGSTWSPMRIIMDMGAPHANNGIGDPAILFDPATRRIWVTALWSKGNRSIAGSLPGISPDTTGQFAMVSSDDDGLTWSAPRSVTPEVKDPIWHLHFAGPGNGIAMRDGRLVFAAQYWDERKMPYSTIIYSDDHGATWKGRIRGPKSNTTESQVVETAPGVLMLNMRDNRGKYRSVATTSDMGGHWTEHPTSYSALQDPVCMGSLIKAEVRTGGGIREVLFFSNPDTQKGRHHITVKASTDLGASWPEAHRLLVDARECYGYSSLVGMGEDRIGILYEGSGDLYFVTYPVGAVLRP